jgi:hypothetical protein
MQRLAHRCSHGDRLLTNSCVAIVDLVGMREAWATEAPNWLQLVRRELDAGWALSRPRFLEFVPEPGA